MPFQDPIFNVSQMALPTGGGRQVLDFIRSTALAAGWLVDEWSPAISISTETGGAELYIHSVIPGITNSPYYSFKVFDASTTDREAIKVYMNDGYSSLARVDNQPGKLAQSKPYPTDAADRNDVFAGQWDNVGSKRNPADPGMYLTAPWDPGDPLAGPKPEIDAAQCSLYTYSTSSIDQIYGFFDINGVAPSRCLFFVWYLGNTMYALSIGHVLWDDEGVAPYDEEGWLLNAWGNAAGADGGTGLPCPESLGGSVHPPAPSSAILEIIRNRTKGSETFPPGVPDGDPLMDSGPVVLQQGRVEASDNQLDDNISAIVRPDQSFDATFNNVQGDAFPNPRITIHREALAGSMQRLGFHRPRHISRFPDGGALTGTFSMGEGTPDWSDSGFSFPHYYAPLSLQRDGDTVTEGTRQYMLFPGNRSGTVPYTQTWRVAGLAMRIA